MTNGNKSANKQGVQFDVAPLPNQEAIVHFKDKVLLDSSSYLDVLAHEHAIAFVVAGMADADLLAETKAAIQSALDSGSDFNAFKRRLKPYLTAKGWLSKDSKTASRRLRLIYHTNLHTAYAAGQWQRIQKTKEFLPYLQYMPSVSENPRLSHKRYYDLVRPVDDAIWASIFPPNGFGCFLGDVQIQGDLQSAMVKWYEGVAVEFTTKSGRNLTVTANHPILTARGWVRADGLTISDDVLCYDLPINTVNVDVLSGQIHHNQTEPTAKNLFKAFFNQTFAFTGTTAFKFNSDVANGEIHIDVINDGLVLHISADVLQGVQKFELIRGDDGRFTSYSNTVGSSDIAVIINDFISSQNAGDVATTAIKAFCQSTLAYFGCGVQMNNFSFQLVISGTTDRPSLSTLPFNATNRLFDTLPTDNTGTAHISQDDTVLTQLASNAFTTDFGLFGYLIDTHASIVFADPVINVRQFSFSGHVYDFQSSESIVSANGIIAHNCKCWVKQLTKRQAEKVGISDAVSLPTEQIHNQRRNVTVTTPKGVEPSFAHNHGDRLSALLKIAETKHGGAFVDKLKAKLNAFMLDLVKSQNIKIEKISHLPTRSHNAVLLSKDPSGKDRLSEGILADKWEQYYQVELERYDINKHKQLVSNNPADYAVIRTNADPKTWVTLDFMFTLEPDASRTEFNRSFNRSPKAWEKRKHRILQHLEKADIIPMYIKYMDIHTRVKIISFVLSLPKQMQQKVVFIE